MNIDLEFITYLNRAADLIHDTARSKGWWDDCFYTVPTAEQKRHFNPQRRNMGEAIALMHSELSEALEGHRNGNGPSDKIPEFNCLEEEFADTIIRILDISKANNLRIGEAILAKMAYNDTRPVKHGGKAY